MKAPKKTVVLLFILFSCPALLLPAQTLLPNLALSEHDLVFKKLPIRWDEAVPLGNGMIGALIWQKGDKLRFSLDRADLWDLRTMENLNRPEWKYSWVYQKVLQKDYKIVQDLFDDPYERNPAPTKIPACALEFDIAGLGDVTSVRLMIRNALCVVEWSSGARLSVFIHATEPAGWFRFEKAKSGLSLSLLPPAFGPPPAEAADSATSQDLSRLGYKQGQVVGEGKSLVYQQKGWGEFHYAVNVVWAENSGVIEGAFGISAHYPDRPPTDSAQEVVRKARARGFLADLASHCRWWEEFWGKSSISIPDKVLERQWNLEMYKFGSAARPGSPPISLQAIWTTDNGKLPPWKGDFHHDLNTQLSYWPAYSSNHLDLEAPFLDWLGEIEPQARRYTRSYFGTSGLNVPGVSTLSGAPMGGWIQYAFSPTISAWLAHHFYLHWRYSMDRDFLARQAYPWIRQVAVHLDELSTKDARGMRTLPISSSPEIHDNSIEAWFTVTTNYDLALIRWTFATAAKLAAELDLEQDVRKWRKILSEWPDLALSPDDNSLLVAAGEEFQNSHRHFSHLLAVHPLGLIDWSAGPREREIISNSLYRLEKPGTGAWVGYSFAWLGNLKARAQDGDGAAKALRTFAECFCLPNSFHANGDQSGTGKSRYTYRPFTLEGNFAFAAGVQEMLLQSHTGIIELFPAIPASWQDVSFRTLRAEGAFLISAERKAGNLREITIQSEKGSRLLIRHPFPGKPFRLNGVAMVTSEEVIDIVTFPGQTIRLEAI